MKPLATTYLTDREDSEESLEQWNNFIANEFPSDFQHSDDWPPLDYYGHTQIENWEKIYYGLHLHFETTTGFLNHESGKYCARFENPTKDLLAQNIAVPGFDIQLDSLGKRHACENGAMLVPNINHVQLLKDRAFLPAMIWLQTLNECHYASGNPRHGSHDLKETLPVFDQWKLDLSLFVSRVRRSSKKHQMVQDGPELMSALTDVDSERRRERGDIKNYVVEPAISIFIKPASVKVRFQKSLSGIVCQLGVMRRPANLPSNWFEYFRHGMVDGPVLTV